MFVQQTNVYPGTDGAAIDARSPKVLLMVVDTVRVVNAYSGFILVAVI